MTLWQSRVAALGRHNLPPLAIRTERCRTMSTLPPPPPPATTGQPGAVDPMLIELVNQAERSVPCAPIKVITASAWITGTPRPSSAFGKSMQPELEKELWEPFKSQKGDQPKADYLAQMAAMAPGY